MTKRKPPAPAAPGRYWRSDQALCIGLDTVPVFFNLGDVKAVEYARSVCERCPVMIQCRESAIAEERGSTGWGIRGGYTPKERKALMKERARKAKLQEAREKQGKVRAA